MSIPNLIALFIYLASVSSETIGIFIALFNNLTVVSSYSLSLKFSTPSLVFSLAFSNKVFRHAKNIEYKNLAWGKYGGRLLSDVYLDGKLYADMIIDEGLARPYDGKTKKGWC